MGIIVNKNQQEDNELSRRINADLRAKAEQTAQSDSPTAPDFVRDSSYTEQLKKTSRFGWIWIVLIVLAIIGVILIFI